MAVTFSQPLDLPQLKTELAAAGIHVPGLGTVGNEVHTYDSQGERVALPPGAQAVVNAHVSGTAAQDAQDTSDLTDFKDNWLQGAQALGWNASTKQWNAAAGQWDGLTPAQRTTFMRRQMQAVRALGRRSGG